MTKNQIEYLRAKTDREKTRLEHLRGMKMLEETNRSNYAKEAETERANRAQESQRALQTAINDRSVQEQERSNLARETETHRANLMNESILGYNASVNKLNADIRQYEAGIQAINAATRQQEADTKDYLANLQAGVNTSNIVHANKQNEYINQQINESEAREAYYKKQAAGMANSQITKNVLDSLYDAAKIAMLFK